MTTSRNREDEMTTTQTYFGLTYWGTEHLSSGSDHYVTWKDES